MSEAVVLEAGALARAMKHAAAIIETRNTIPILANARLVTVDGALEIATSDLDVEHRQAVPMVSGGELATTVDARRFASLVSAVDDRAQVSLAIDGGRLVVRSGRSRWVIPVLPAKDFPLQEFDGSAPSVTLPAAHLAEVIGRVEWAVSTNPAKPYLHGPLLDSEGGRARLVGCDGSLLVCAPLEAEWPEAAPAVIAGPKYIRAVQRVAAEIGGDCELAWDEKRIRAVMAGRAITLLGKTIEGTFPDYRRIVPPRQEAPLVFEPGPLRAALRRVSLVADAKTRFVALERSEDAMALTSSDASAGEAREDIPASGPAAARAGFNGQLLDRIVEAIGGDTVEMHQADPGSGARFERTVSDGAVAILMPMRG